MGRIVRLKMEQDVSLALSTQCDPSSVGPLGGQGRAHEHLSRREQRVRPAVVETTPHARLGSRSLDHFPSPARRSFYVVLIVLATVTLFYEFSVAGAVGPSIISHYHMTFNFYVYIAVAASIAGAIAALLGGLVDRWGRANLIAYGLVVTGLLTLLGIPHSPNKWVFLTLFSVLGFAEGVILVASSALIRDFSPQVRRAAAMGFWSLGPVLGSLIVTEVSSHSLSHLGPWQDQFTICGVVGLAVAAAAVAGLRELSPQLRDQLMVSSTRRGPHRVAGRGNRRRRLDRAPVAPDAPP